MNLTALFFRTKKKINLLPKDPFEESLLGRVLSWGLTVGKWIVIVTQIVVVSVFLFRFSLDRKLNNLRRDIGKEVVKIKAYESIENNFRLAQARILLAKDLIANQDKIKLGFKEQAQLIPDDIWLEKIEINQKQINLVAYAYSMNSFNRFLENLRASKKFKKISIQNIESGAEKQAKLKFNLTVDFQEENGR